MTLPDNSRRLEALAQSMFLPLVATDCEKAGVCLCFCRRFWGFRLPTQRAHDQGERRTEDGGLPVPKKGSRPLAWLSEPYRAIGVLITESSLTGVLIDSHEMSANEDAVTLPTASGKTVETRLHSCYLTVTDCLWTL